MMSDDDLRPEKPPVKWATIREDATERGLFAIVDEAMIGRKLTPSRRKLIVGNIVMAVAKWRESFRDCGCWLKGDGYALCQWHERMLQTQTSPLRAALAATPPAPAPLDVRDPRFEAAVDAVFAAPGEFGPAKGYYGSDTGHFIDMLEVALAPEQPEPPATAPLDVWLVLREQQPMAVWDSEADARADVDRRTEHGARPDLGHKYSVEHWSVGRAVLAPEQPE